jgi:hypothetical protein
LSPETLARLLETVRAAKIHSLSYSSPVLDQPTFVLRSDLEQVRIHGPRDFPPGPEQTRFSTAWNAILAYAVKVGGVSPADYRMTP